MNEPSLHKTYKQQAAQLNHFRLTGKKIVGWESPSNIALLKYWGKQGEQLPQNPSVSFNLKHSKTTTKIYYRKKKNRESSIEYFFKNERNGTFENRVKNYFEKLDVYMPFLEKLDFIIYSENTFPHSAGIASSASSFSALAHGLCSIEKELFYTLKSPGEFHQKASFVARLGSGSASRSVPGKTVLWGHTDLVNGSSNEYAIPLDHQVHEQFKTYRDAILIIDSGLKDFSSSQGHALMENHPFAQSRYLQAGKNLEMLLLALKTGSEKLFAGIVESEAMTLHALMLSSNPPASLMKPNTLAILEKLIKFRKHSSLEFSFTLDAGPNIHILYPHKSRVRIVDFIRNELVAFCENGSWIDDEVSTGPKQIFYDI
ncbi:MAG: hypothetical protein V2I54_00990 [Bacteroidales bacterium]|jgi:diphosphomevalonate decarboxylase|nr:hypothetical protein [Bacteroidales bacterium]